MSAKATPLPRIKQADLTLDQFGELLGERRWCYHIPRDTGFVDGKGWRVSVVVENVEGHWPTGDLNFDDIANHKEPWFWGMTYDDAEQTAAEMNQRLELSESDIWQIVSSSMFFGVGRRKGNGKRSRRGTAP